MKRKSRPLLLVFVLGRMLLPPVLALARLGLALGFRGGQFSLLGVGVRPEAGQLLNRANRLRVNVGVQVHRLAVPVPVLALAHLDAAPAGRVARVVQPPAEDLLVPRRLQPFRVCYLVAVPVLDFLLFLLALEAVAVKNVQGEEIAEAGLAQLVVDRQ